MSLPCSHFIERASYEYFSTIVTSLGHFALFVFCNEISCWFMKEVHALLGKLHVNANFRCPTSEQKLSQVCRGRSLIWVQTRTVYGVTYSLWIYI